jgi:hypothetical protein
MFCGDVGSVIGDGLSLRCDYEEPVEKLCLPVCIYKMISS